MVCLTMPRSKGESHTCRAKQEKKKNKVSIFTDDRSLSLKRQLMKIRVRLLMIIKGCQSLLKNINMGP